MHKKVRTGRTERKCHKGIEEVIKSKSKLRKLKDTIRHKTKTIKWKHLIVLISF